LHEPSEDAFAFGAQLLAQALVFATFEADVEVVEADAPPDRFRVRVEGGEVVGADPELRVVRELLLGAVDLPGGNRVLTREAFDEVLVEGGGLGELGGLDPPAGLRLHPV
jgi:hypothetical protein